MSSTSRHQRFDVYTFSAVTGATNVGAQTRLDNFESCIVYINCTVVGTSFVVTPMGSSDGTNYAALYDPTGNAMTSGTVSATGWRAFQVRGPLPAYFAVNVNVTGTAVTATVTIEATKGGMF